MDYSSQIAMEKAAKAQAYVGGATLAGASVPVDPALLRFADRLQKINGEFQEVGHRLDCHADRVHGERPEAGNKSAAYPVRSGALGTLEDALDRLNETLSFVREAADRNCNLA